MREISNRTKWKHIWTGFLTKLSRKRDFKSCENPGRREKKTQFGKTNRLQTLQNTCAKFNLPILLTFANA